MFLILKYLALPLYIGTVDTRHRVFLFENCKQKLIGSWRLLVWVRCLQNLIFNYVQMDGWRKVFMVDSITIRF